MAEDSPDVLLDILLGLHLQALRVSKGHRGHGRLGLTSAVVPAGSGLPQVRGGGRQAITVPSTGTRYEMS